MWVFGTRKRIAKLVNRTLTLEERSAAAKELGRSRSRIAIPILIEISKDAKESRRIV